MSGLDDIEARATADEVARNPPERTSIEHDTTQKRRHTWNAKYFKVGMTDDHLDQFKLMDPVGKRFYVGGKMRMRSKKALEAAEIFNLPDGVFDKEREALVDAISEQ